MSKKKLFVGLRPLVSLTLVAAAGFAVSGGGRLSSPFDDARAYFIGATDQSGDGIFQKGEWRDIVHSSDPTHGFHDTMPSSTSEKSDKVTIVRGNVVCPYRNATLFDMPCLGFPHPATTNGLVTIDDVTYPVVTVAPNYLTMPDFLSDYASTTCSAYTAVLRFRYYEPVSHISDQQSTLAHFGFKWVAGGGHGIGVGLVRGQADPDNNARRMQLYCGAGAWTDTSYVGKDNNGTVYPYIYPGSWVDLAVRVRGQNVTLAYTWNDVRDGTVTATNRHVRFWTTNVDTRYCPAIVPGYHGFKLGGELATSSAITFTNGYVAAKVDNNSLKCFRGCVQRYAFWSRDLSDGEILAAFAEPRPGMARVGLQQGTVAEFTAETTSVHVDGQWQRLNPVLVAKDSRIEVKFTSDAMMAGLPQHFRVWFAARPADQPLPALMVNGTSVTCVEDNDAMRADWLVPKDVITVGTNTVTLLRTDEGAGNLSVDALEFGGSWRLGSTTVPAAETFSHESYGTNVFHVSDGNMWHLKRGLSGSSVNRYTEYVFPLSEGLGGRCKAIFSLRVEGWAGGVVDKTLTLFVNGDQLEAKEVASDATVSWKIPAERLRAGENTIKVYKNDNGGWLNVRCVEFELKGISRGVVLIVR